MKLKIQTIVAIVLWILASGLMYVEDSTPYFNETYSKIISAIILLACIQTIIVLVNWTKSHKKNKSGLTPGAKFVGTRAEVEAAIYDGTIRDGMIVYIKEEPNEPAESVPSIFSSVRKE